MGLVLDRLGNWLGRALSRPVHVHGSAQPTPQDMLQACLRPGDVLLVEGHSRVRSAIKYLTQSTWSHAALFVGDALAGRAPAGHCFIEADIVEGVRSVGVAEFDGLLTRICRPSRMTDADCDRVVAFAVERIGLRYDLRNVFDLARYLFPTPPVPQRGQRRQAAQRRVGQQVAGDVEGDEVARPGQAQQLPRLRPGRPAPAVERKQAGVDDQPGPGPGQRHGRTAVTGWLGPQRWALRARTA